MKPRINIIVATAHNNVIGKDNGMPWHMPADLKHFKSITYGHPVIMGRKTFESVGKPLPGRDSIVISRQKDLSYDFDNVQVVHSFFDAVKAASDYQDAFVIGGSNIYQLALPVAERIYLTRIDASPEGDTFFPEINMDLWKVVEEEKHETDERNKHAYTFQILDRIKNE